MSNPNHASLGIPMGQPVVEMLSVFEGSATSYSRRFNDQWDTAGLKDAAGNPTCTSHYGMHMVAWHIPLAVSGPVQTRIVQACLGLCGARFERRWCNACGLYRGARRS